MQNNYKPQLDFAMKRQTVAQALRHHDAAPVDSHPHEARRVP